MKVGIATPVSLHLLADLVEDGHELPAGYQFPPHAQLVREYVERGHEVSLFTLAPELREPRTFRGDRLRIHVGRFRPARRARDFFAVERADLVAAMRADPCDVVHAHWTYEFALAAMDSGRPHVVTAHDAPLAIWKLHRDGYRFLRLLMAFPAIRRARVLTAVSAYVAEHIARVFRYRAPIHVVPNGLPASVFAAGNAREGHTAGTAARFASVLTGWSRVKNAATLLRAFATVR
ncbi:MAG TPA: glycosyltransferase family 4 protein, partial [Longimicrobium sp.]|nr:glycosyltransferase family 4 protein [Longimicrobium sp.]